MKLKAIFLAAAGLLALAQSLSYDPASGDDNIDTAAPAVVARAASGNVHLEKNNAGSLPKGDCYMNCEVPLDHCILDYHDGKDECNRKCSCSLFNNPGLLCRIRGM